MQEAKVLLLTFLVILDTSYLVRCILDATLVAFLNDDHMLETRPKFIAKRFFSNKTNILYRVIIITPFYFVDPNICYVRIFMFSEYEDMQLFCKSFIKLFFFFLENDLTKYIVVNSITTLLLLTLYLMLFAHTCACIFILTERYALDDDPSKGHYQNRYTSVLYFMITTSSTVGNGDITISHAARRLVNIRYIYQIVLMLASLMVNSIFFSVINMSVNDAVYVSEQYYETVEDFRAWVFTRLKYAGSLFGMSKYYRRVDAEFTFQYNFGLQKFLNYKGFIDQISTADGHTIKDYTSQNFEDKFKPFFEPLSKELTLKIIHAMKPTT